MAFSKGHTVKVEYLSTQIIGMGKYTLNATMTFDKLEDTEFGDTFKTYCYGLKDGLGTITVSGMLDVADSTGFLALVGEHYEGTLITSFKLFVDATSYYEPNATAGYIASGIWSAGFGTQVSTLLITGWTIDADKSGLLTVNWSMDINGTMSMV